MDYEERLREIVRGNAWLMRVLRAVHSLDLPHWVVGSGVIRNVVWDALHDYSAPTPVNDVDVAFSDPLDVTRARDAAIENQLTELLPDVPWEVTNQAGVHLWYQKKFGDPIRELTSIEDALAHWPETATSVGVHLLPGDDVAIVAPCGLDDLFNLVLRRNATQVSREFFRKRAVDKRIRERWPKVTIVDG